MTGGGGRRARTRGGASEQYGDKGRGASGLYGEEEGGVGGMRLGVGGSVFGARVCCRAPARAAPGSRRRAAGA